MIYLLLTGKRLLRQLPYFPLYFAVNPPDKRCRNQNANDPPYRFCPHRCLSFYVIAHT
jgi:hypothetical protein